MCQLMEVTVQHSNNQVATGCWADRTLTLTEGRKSASCSAQGPWTSLQGHTMTNAIVEIWDIPYLLLYTEQKLPSTELGQETVGPSEPQGCSPALLFSARTGATHLGWPTNPQRGGPSSVLQEAVPRMTLAGLQLLQNEKKKKSNYNMNSNSCSNFYGKFRRIWSWGI